mgnify:CR=1 FL=1
MYTFILYFIYIFTNIKLYIIAKLKFLTNYVNNYIYKKYFLNQNNIDYMRDQVKKATFERLKNIPKTDPEKKNSEQKIILTRSKKIDMYSEYELKKLEKKYAQIANDWIK